MFGSSSTAKGPKGQFGITKASVKPRRPFFRLGEQNYNSGEWVALLTVDTCSPPKQALVLPKHDRVSCSAMRVYCIFTVR